MSKFRELISRPTEHFDTELYEDETREDLQPGCVARLKDSDGFL